MLSFHCEVKSIQVLCNPSPNWSTQQLTSWVKPSFCWNHADETPRRTHVEPGIPGKPQFDATCWRHAEIARIRQMFAEQTFVSADLTFLLFSLSNAIVFRDIWFSNSFKFTSTLSIASHLTIQRVSCDEQYDLCISWNDIGTSRIAFRRSPR